MELRQRIGAILSALLVISGLTLVAWPGITWVYGYYWQERLEENFRKQALATTPVSFTGKTAQAKSSNSRPWTHTAATGSTKPRRQLRSGQALARLRIERINLDAVVVEGVDRLALRKGPGHLPQTAQPGERGNCAIAAHRDGWFEALPELQIGDSVWLESADTRFHYRVEEKQVVTPDRGDLLNRGPLPQLTLITCTGPGYPRSRYRLLVFCSLRYVEEKGNSMTTDPKLKHQN